MTAANFSLEFQLSIPEIRKLNKMYFKYLFKERIASCLFTFLLLLILVDYIIEIDFFQWLMRSSLIIVFFLLIQYAFVEPISKIIFKKASKLLRFNKVANCYKFNFTNSLICVSSPLGEIKHKWNKIEKAVLTKDFFFLYIKERNAYIISISAKNNNGRDISKLLDFIESNVTHVIKI